MAKQKITRRQFYEMGEEQRADYNFKHHGLQTTDYIYSLPPVPNAVAGRPFNLRSCSVPTQTMKARARILSRGGFI